MVTNPPFSLFREFVGTLMEHGKKFIVWGNNNAVTYKEFFPLIREDKLWLGYLSNKTCIFGVGDGYRYDEKVTAQMNDGMKYGKVPAISTFTNLDIQKRHDNLILYKHYSPEEFPKYDNYDAINVDKVSDIPLDYNGVMGVPITFMNQYNPDQFEIIGLGIANLGLECGVQPYKPHHKQYRKEVQHKGQVDGDLYMVDANDHPVVPYARILIRQRLLR